MEYGAPNAFFLPRLVSHCPPAGLGGRRCGRITRNEELDQRLESRGLKAPLGVERGPWHPGQAGISQ